MELQEVEENCIKKRFIQGDSGGVTATYGSHF
jgi:hypothetical protein